MKARGTYRKDRHGDRVDEEFEGKPKPIRRLTGDGLKLWKFVIDSLPDKLLAEADALLIQLMCEAYARYIKAQKEYDKDGDWKAFCKMQAFAKQVREIASRMGMSPVDRAKITRDTGEKAAKKRRTKNPVEAMLDRHFSNQN